MMPLEGPAMYRRDTYHPVCARHDPVGGVPERALFVVKWLVRRSAPAPASVGRCSLASRSVLPAPAVRTRAGLHLDPGCAPAGSAPVRSRPKWERPLTGAGSRVGGGPGVAFPKSRSIGV